MSWRLAPMRCSTLDLERFGGLGGLQGEALHLVARRRRSSCPHPPAPRRLDDGVEREELGLHHHLAVGAAEALQIVMVILFDEQSRTPPCAATDAD